MANEKKSLSVTCSIDMRFLPGDQTPAVQLLLSTVGPTEATPGCTKCSVARDAGDEDVVHYSEAWASETDFRKHLKSDTFRRVLTAMDMSCEEPHVTVGTLAGQSGIAHLRAIRDQKDTQTTNDPQYLTKATGFLGNYSQLQEGEGDEAQLVYIRPRVKWAAYNKIIIDPIMVYAIPGNPLAKLPKDQLNGLAGYLYATLHEQLSADYQIVTRPGPGVLRLRVALTEAGAGKPVLGVISSVTPPGIALSTLKTVATGQGTGTGTARVEMEMQDSLTRQRLAAAVDAQAGNKRDFFGNFNKWDDAQDAFDGWAAQLHQRLLELRAGGQ